MTMQQIITTFAGAFIFPFLIRLVWGRLCDTFGPIGGWLAGAFVVGLTWTLNHGVGLIHQTGTAWIDMAWAAGTGLFTASALSGDNVGKGLVNYMFAIIGGLLGGYILSCTGLFVIA